MLIFCFVKRKQFSVDISSKLGTGFSLVPFVLVVVSFLPLPLMCDYYVSVLMHFFASNRLTSFCSFLFGIFSFDKNLRLFPDAAILIFSCENFQSICTILAMIATLPVVQLFFFHILLIKKVRLTALWYIDYLVNTGS